MIILSGIASVLCLVASIGFVLNPIENQLLNSVIVLTMAFCSGLALGLNFINIFMKAIK